MSYNTDLQSNNTDLQGVLDMINALPEAGGGLPVGIIKINTGSVVLDTAGTQLSFEHGLGERPNFWSIYTEDATYGVLSSGETISAVGVSIPNTGDLETSHFYFGTNIYSRNRIGTFIGDDTATDSEKVNINATATTFAAGVTYHWIAAVVEGMSTE